LEGLLLKAAARFAASTDAERQSGKVRTATCCLNIAHLHFRDPRQAGEHRRSAQATANSHAANARAIEILV
jgi:hypothetical protein